MRIDLNADVGEGAPSEDQGLFGAITSASVAAGFHAGSPAIIRQTLRRARAQGVAVGAHPSYPDREGFGRRDMGVTASEAGDLVLYQVAAVAGLAAAEGLRLQHVKPHGALYNSAARDPALARAVAKAVAEFDRTLLVFGPPGSALDAAAREAGLTFAAEGFADRAYNPDGSLVSRGLPGALLTDPDRIVARVLKMVAAQTVTAVDGTELPLAVQTICIHSDTEGAARLAQRLRAGLEAAGISCGPPALR